MNGPGKHTITALVCNRPGVLARVAGLFSRRGFNIESLSVNVTHDPALSRMTLVVEGEESVLEQLTKQLYKLIDVVKVRDHLDNRVVERELALVKVNAAPKSRSQIMEISTVFRANIVDVSENTFTVEVTGRSDKIDAFLRMVRPFGVCEMVRTGRILLVRGEKTSED